MSAESADIDRHVATLDDVRAACERVTDTDLLAGCAVEVAIEAYDANSRGGAWHHAGLVELAIAQMLATSLRNPKANLAAAMLVLTERMTATWRLMVDGEKLALQAVLHAAATVEALRIGAPCVDALVKAVACAADARALDGATLEAREGERHRVYAGAVATLGRAIP